MTTDDGRRTTASPLPLGEGQGGCPLGDAPRGAEETSHSALRTPHPTQSSVLSPPELPLAGVRVLDLTQVVGPPFGMMLLADMGAEVIRIESRQHWQSTTRGVMARPSMEVVVNTTLMSSGYPDLEPGERPWNPFAMFNMHARNKLGMTVDLMRPEGRQVLLDLVR